MRLIYTRPRLKDLSQGSRIAFARQFRLQTQDNISDKLGLTGECKRRTMTRYEKGDRNPKEERTKEISEILNISYDSIKQYDYKNIIDVIYTLLWLEELLPKYEININDVPNIKEENLIKIKKFINEWDLIKSKRLKREISYEEYIEWKLNYSLEEE